MKIFPTLLIIIFFYSDALSQTPPPPQQEPIYQVVESMPRFPGCEGDDIQQSEKTDCAIGRLLKFIYENLKYPAEAKQSPKTEGTVIVQFIVGKDGSITDPKIVKDIGSGCGKEALRVINLMPTWIPGTQGGKPVKVKYTLPVKFALDN